MKAPLIVGLVVYLAIAAAFFVFLIAMSSFDPEGGIHTPGGYLTAALVALFWPIAIVLSLIGG